MSFKVGDLVFWESQAAGINRRKEGQIIEVVPSGSKPRHLVSGAGGSRDHESYVVRARAIGTVTESWKKYWPIANKLQVLPPREPITEELDKDGVRQMAEAEDKAAVAELRAKEASDLRKLVDVDMTKDDVITVEPTYAESLAIAEAHDTIVSMVYHAHDLTTGLLRVMSKEEYDVAIKAAAPVDPELAALGTGTAPPMTEEEIEKSRQQQQEWDAAHPEMAGQMESKG